MQLVSRTFHLPKLKLQPLNTRCPSPPPAPGTHHLFTSFLCELDDSGDLTGSHRVCPSVTGLCLVAQCPKVHACCRVCQNLLFLRLNTPLCGRTTSSYPFISQWTPGWFLPVGRCVCAALNIGYRCLFKSQLSTIWTNIQEWNCWLVW